MKNKDEARRDFEKLFNIQIPPSQPKVLSPEPPQAPVILIEPEDREVPVGAAGAFTVKVR